MRSELDEEFIKLFAQLPERVQKAARKNYGSSGFEGIRKANEKGRLII